MSTTSLATGTSTSLVLDRAVAAVDARRRADVEVLEAALAWAHAHVLPAENLEDLEDLDEVAGWRSDTMPGPGSAAALFGERPVPLAGAGTPLVAEFCVMELSAALDQSHEATLALPRLWALVRALRVPVRLAREAARVSRDLDLAAAGHADRLLVWQPRRLNPHRIGVLVHEARLYADPDRAIADHDTALGARKVECRYGPDGTGGTGGSGAAPGTGEVFMVLDVADTIALDHTVSTMASTMASLGHPGDLGVRRAHAVGLLADPQKALDLLAAADLADPDRPIDPDHDPAVCVAEDAAYEPPSPFRRPTVGEGSAPGGAGGTGGAGAAGTQAGEVRLVLHVTDRDLLDGNLGEGHSIDTCGVARSEQLGPMLLGRLRSWLLTAGKVSIQPVLDLDPATTSIAAVDRHDPPARMAAAVRFRDETCVFPGCNRPSIRSDLDHIEDYVPLHEGGPPGQTRPENLAPLCRRHHRAKTFGHFTYRRLPDGSYEWTLPSGRVITTDPPRPRPRPDPDPGPDADPEQPRP